MTSLNRRQALMLSVSAVAAASIPVTALSLPVPAKPLLPAWAVGTPGEYNWQYMRAATEEAARRFWAEEQAGGPCDAPNNPECDCEFCYYHGSAEADHVKAWDELGHEPNAGDWMRAGLGSICSRCGYETHRDADGHGVGKEAVCEECMTLADWEAVDPERAAEVRAEALAE